MTREETLTEQEQDYFASRGMSGLTEEDGMEAASLDAPAAQDETQDEAQDVVADNFTRMVPHQALHAEREEHKKTKALLAQLRAEKEQSNSNIGATSMEQPTNPPPDAAGAAEIENALWQRWNQSYETGKAEMPDLDEALAYLSQTREQQLRALARLDRRLAEPQARTAQMREELRTIVAASMQQGTSPAKIIYDLARDYGYGTLPMSRGVEGIMPDRERKGGGVEEQRPDREQKQGGVEGIMPDREQGRTASTAMRFEHLSAAQNAARTLAASHGRDAGQPPLLETLAQLSEEEFARWYEGNEHSFRQMFGG